VNLGCRRALVSPENGRRKDEQQEKSQPCNNTYELDVFHQTFPFAQVESSSVELGWGSSEVAQSHRSSGKNCSLKTLLPGFCSEQPDSSELNAGRARRFVILRPANGCILLEIKEEHCCHGFQTTEGRDDSRGFSHRFRGRVSVEKESEVLPQKAAARILPQRFASQRRLFACCWRSILDGRRACLWPLGVGMALAVGDWHPLNNPNLSFRSIEAEGHRIFLSPKLKIEAPLIA
jgi:hypothetical protein